MNIHSPSSPSSRTPNQYPLEGNEEDALPLFLDRHEAAGSTAEETAKNHAADLEIAGDYGVEFLSYWHDADTGLVFCFARAPDADSMSGAHEASHGQVAAEIIEVSETDVVRFLGEVHDPADASEVTSAFRVIGFTDLVGSTQLLDRLGQSEYMVLLTEHDLTIRRSLLRSQGREVKHTGDGIMVVFSDVQPALDWALDVMDDFASQPDLDIRIGLAAGEPVESGSDLFGDAVTLASRICEEASSGEILTSDRVAQLGAATGFTFDEGAPRQLKGFTGQQTVHRLQSGNRFR